MSDETEEVKTEEERSLESNRETLHYLDETIGRLVYQRRQLSRQVMNQKVDMGLGRVDLQQEKKVIKAYITALGDSGRAVGEAVLKVCKGETT